MIPIVAIIAPGLMGAAVGKRLVDNGLRVVTSLKGRSQETVDRAINAGMAAASDDEIASADFILSIVPSDDALTLAERFVPALTASNSKPIFVECNAVNRSTLERIAAAITPTGCQFVDAGIIGPPPTNSPPPENGKAKIAGPRFYASGEATPQFASLRNYGLDVRLLDGGLGAASTLKMSHSGIAKGVTAIGAAMILAATRAGSADELLKELQFSQPEMLSWFKRQLPHMPTRAGRWVAEMHEIAGFVDDDPAARQIYEGAAHFYQRIADDFATDKRDVSALADFLAESSP
jgi:putative dehydrogenase